MTENTLLTQARQDDWNRAGQYCQEGDTDLKDRWNKFAASYQRFHEQGGNFHLARLKSLAKYVGHDLESTTVATNTDIQIVGDRLLNRVMDARAQEVAVEVPASAPKTETADKTTVESAGEVTRDDIDDFFSRTRAPGMRVTQ